MATYYVKTNGGSGTGTDDTNAWSFAHLNATTLSPGDSVLFKRGELFEGELITRSGSAGNVVTYGAYGSGNLPKITALQELSSWTQHSGSIYYAALDVVTLNLVTLDGVVKGMGRYPNTGYLTYTGHTNNTAISGATIGALPFDATGGEVVIRKYRWVLDRQPIASHSGNIITYTPGYTYGNSDAYNPVDGNGYFIQKHLSCVTDEGDWYYDTDTNRLYMHFGAGTPSGRTVMASVVDRNFATSSKHYITFENLEFEGGNVHGAFLTSCSNITINSCTFSSQGGIGIYGISVTNITINSTDITDALSSGIWVETGGSYVTVSNGCTISDIGIAGMGRSGESSYSGIIVDGNNTTITNNTVENVGYIGIRFGGNNALVQYNVIDTFCTIKDDGGGIYTYSGTVTAHTNRVVSNNIVLNAIGAYAGAEAYSYEAFGKASGIYIDDYSDNIEVTGNVVAYGEWIGIFIHNGYANEITDNLVYDFDHAFEINQSSAITRNLIVTGNTFIALSPEQIALYVDMSLSDDISLFGTFDNNVYARPVDDTTTITVKRDYSGGGGETALSLATWQSTYGLDATSSKSLVTTTSPSNMTLEYNGTSSAEAVPLTGQWKDVENNLYTTEVTLPAFSGLVLISHNITASSQKIIKTSSSKILKINGKVLYTQTTS